MAEIYSAIHRRNHMPCAYDPTSHGASGWTHYVVVVARSVRLNMVEKQAKWDRVAELTEDGEVPDNLSMECGHYE